MALLTSLLALVPCALFAAGVGYLGWILFRSVALSPVLPSRQVERFFPVQGRWLRYFFAAVVAGPLLGSSAFLLAYLLVPLVYGAFILICHGRW